MLVPWVLLAAAGCRAKDPKSDGATTDGAKLIEAGTSMLAGQVEVTTMEDLGISEALALEPTPGVKAEGEEVAVDGGGKVLTRLRRDRLRSREACRVRQRLRDSSNALRRVAVQFCHLEAASDAIEFGKKLHFMTSGLRGSEPVKLSVWVEGPKDGKLRVSTCVDDKLRGVVEVEPRGDRRSRGSFVFVDDGDVARVSSQGIFDNHVSNATRSFFATRSYMKFKNDGGSIAEKSALIVNPLGRSVMLNSSAGTFASPETGEEVSFSLSGAAKIGEKLGTALVQFGDEGAHRAYFDGKGKVLPALNVRPLIVAAGLWIKQEELLPLTPASFRPVGFAKSAWDCSGTTEVERPGPAEVYAACHAKPSFAEEDCEGTGYQLSRREKLTLATLKGSVTGFGDVEKADTADTTVAREDDEGEEEAIGDGEPDDE
jgi:hypothetical protein